jgi:hypothetical protein
MQQATEREVIEYLWPHKRSVKQRSVTRRFMRGINKIVMNNSSLTTSCSLLMAPSDQTPVFRAHTPGHEPNKARPQSASL